MKKALVSLAAAAVAVAALGFTAMADDNSAYTIGFSSKDNSDMFVKNIVDAAQEKADELGVNLLIADARGDVNTQISDVEGEINGLYTYDRKILKINKEKILEANRELTRIYEDNCI